MASYRLTYSAACGNPSSIVVGADGNLWFGDWFGSHAIHRITTGGLISNFGGLSTHVANLTVGPDGNIWAGTEGGGANALVSIDSYGHEVVHTTPGYINATALAVGADAQLWYYSYSAPTTVRSMSTAGVPGASIATNDSMCFGAHGKIMISGPDGNLWYPTRYQNTLQKVNPLTKTITSIPLQSNALAEGVTIGPDGNIWLTESGSDTIARVTSSGMVTEWSRTSIGINSSATPMDITTGPDGNMWFAEYGSNSIGKFVL